VTLATDGRAPRFEGEQLALSCIESLGAAAEHEGVDILSYVFMTDHVHLLIQGSEEASLPRLMKRFKQDTGFHFKQRTGFSLWQKGYHDHILRREEDVNDVAQYVAANPVRAGLVKDWGEYPFTGGLLLAGALNGDLKVAATSQTATSQGSISSGEAPA
jgi:REP element-mobilizing transposase RayT